MSNQDRYKWHPSMTEMVYRYMAEEDNNRTIKSLSKVLGVSRESIYNWCRAHKEFREAIHRMRHMQVMSHHLWAQDIEPEPGEGEE